MASRSYLLMLGPGLAVYLAFIIVPFGASIFYSLYNWSGIGPLGPFIGLANYRYVLFSSSFSPFFYRAMLHNLIFFAIVTVVTGLGGMFFAYLMLRVSVRTSRVLQLVYFLPFVIPPVVVGYLVDVFLQPGYGVLPNLFALTHLAFLNQPYLGRSGLALPTIALVASWSGFGFTLLIFLATMVGLPQDVLEAAQVDGSRSFQVLRHIVFPLVLPTFLVVCTLNFINAFGVFDLIYVLEGAEAGPNFATDVTGTLFYRTAFGGSFGASVGYMSIAAAMASISFLFVMIVSGVLVRLQKRYAVQY